MPELPEVETIKLGLSKKIVGLKIKNVDVLEKRSFFGDKKIIEGKKIINIWRRAKVLGIELEGKTTLLFHLKMSGQIIYVESLESRIKSHGKRFIGGHPTHDMHGELPNRSTRVIFELNNPRLKTLATSHLYFNDQRKFGWIKVLKTSEVEKQSLIKSLGPEPLDENFTAETLKKNLLRHKSQAIKVAMLDQTVVSGIGNIYASECCFNAGIDPRKKVSELSDKEFEKLHLGVIKALSDGIKYGGSSKTHFVNAEGKKGYFLDHAFVYWKDGEKCKACGSEIKKLQLGGRGTYYCPKCQN